MGYMTEQALTSKKHGFSISISLFVCVMLYGGLWMLYAFEIPSRQFWNIFECLLSLFQVFLNTW